ncbi:LuxR C-terminal-related transcriptional regulator [Streptomyces sp. NPDC005483]|uniref:LuxR C-terminal-related transcriptional regulator n=1 Tax=Streptomyces sp. NPDC005483 TaxID=3154882 RepID=UPI0033A2CE8C
MYELGLQGQVGDGSDAGRTTEGASSAPASSRLDAQRTLLRLSEGTFMITFMADDPRNGGLLPEGVLVPAGREGAHPAGASGFVLSEVGGVGPLPYGVELGFRHLLGRDAEVEALMAALTGLKEGAGRAIALVGESGTGKSTLMGTAAAYARAMQVEVAVLVAHGGGAGTVPPPTATASAESVGRVAARATRSAAVVAVVDDLHQLSADQIEGVERLIEATAAGPVLCLLAYRQSRLSPAHAALLSRAVSADLLEVWHLAPLSQEHPRDVLDDHPDAHEVRRETTANKQHLKAIPAPHGSIDSGTAVLGELVGLEPDVLKALQAAAVLGEPFHPELLAAVAGLEIRETMTALDTLIRLDLVRPTEPTTQLALRHQTVEEAVYQQLEFSRRITLHRRAERALAEQGAPIARRAHHVARAADPNRPEHLMTLIAATRGVLYAKPAVAAEYLHAALPLLQEGQAHWHEVQVLLARTRLLTGNASEGRALLDALRSAMPGGQPSEATTLADSSRIERRLGRYTEAGAIARAGLAALADHDTATAAALHTELADYAYDLQDYETSRKHAETAAAIAHRHHDDIGESNALAQSALAHLFTGDQATARATTTRAAELIDAASDATLVTNLEAAFQLGMTEGMLGLLFDAERHLTRGAALSKSTGQTYIQPQILTVLANTQLRSGNLRRTLTTLDETARHIEQVGNPSTEAIIAMVRAETLYWRGDPGDLQDAVALAEHAAAIAGDTPTAWAVTVRCFNAEFVLLTGDTARARWLLLNAADGTDLPRLTTWRKPRWCDTLAQAAFAEGDHASVDHWAQLAETCLEQLPSTSRQGFALRARMRAHALSGAAEQAVRSAKEAITAFSASGERIEVCRTLLTAAELSLHVGRTHEVANWLDRAGILADQCGSARLAEAVTYQRGSLAAHAAEPDVPDALASLTAREREIAGLVSTGMTNGQIASTLVLSVRTVETHLGQAYRKLGVSNRASLTRIMLNSGTHHPPGTTPG